MRNVKLLDHIEFRLFKKRGREEGRKRARKGRGDRKRYIGRVMKGRINIPHHIKVSFIHIIFRATLKRFLTFKI